MAVQEPKKTLRIAVFRGKNLKQEGSLDKRRTVSIGQDTTNTFCIESSAVPKKWNLFVYDSVKDTYSLCIDSSKMRGRIFIRQGQELKLDDSLDTSKHNIRVTGDHTYIPLTNQSRGRINIGKYSILFEFKIVRDELAAARLLYEPPSVWSKLGEFIPRVLAYGLIFSLLLHIVPLVYIGVQDWPRDDELLLMPSVFKPVVIDEMVLDDEKPPEQLDEPQLIDDTDNIADIPSDEPSDDGGATKDELMDRITDKHREQGAQITAQILGVDGGIDGFYADMLGANSHIADMSDIAAGDIGASAGGNLLNALAAGEGGNVGSGLMGLDSGGVKNGPQVVVDNKAKNTTHAKVEFKVTDKSEFAVAPPPGSKEAIEKMFARKKGDITGCYQRVMNAQGKASGRFVISILVQKDGTVQKIEKIEDQIGGDMFTCVRQRIMNWNFGTLERPIAFKKTWVFS